MSYTLTFSDEAQEHLGDLAAMKTLALEQTSPAFRRAARLAKGEVLLLTRRGKPALAVVGVEDEFALEALTLGRNAELMTYLDGIAERMKRGKAATLDEVYAKFGLSPEPPKRRRARNGNGNRGAR